MNTERQFKVDNYLRIAKTTSDESLRNELLMKALELLEEGPEKEYDNLSELVDVFLKDGDFIVTNNPYHKVTKKDLEDSLTVFLLKNGYGYISRKELKKIMEIKGFKLTKNSNWYYRGIAKETDDLEIYKTAHSELMEYFNENRDKFRNNGLDKAWGYYSKARYFIKDLSTISDGVKVDLDIYEILRAWKISGVLEAEYGRLQKTTTSDRGRKRHYVIKDVYSSEA